QFFIATHSPIIAAQFEPCERVILAFDEEGFVTSASTHRGSVPTGDDPNDMLIKDFQVKSIYGKEGLAKWNRYIELKQLIQQEQGKTQKLALMQEYMKIGNDYNFLPTHEIFNQK
ncbi:MAG: hypothetical protein ACKVTZ_12645, partial [Bacteroidia bacterium]